MEDLSEENIRKNCPHCDLTSHAFEQPLEQTENFHIICDTHDLIEGHLLVMPKPHISCIGEYSSALLSEFEELYKKVSKFVQDQYGSVCTFEHGILGQTVFHSHVHFLPFNGLPEQIVPEGLNNLSVLPDLKALRDIFKRDGGYLFFSIGNSMWTVNPQLAAPRFFRDRFAKALGTPERADWKAARQNPELLKTFWQENSQVQAKWQSANPLET